VPGAYHATSSPDEFTKFKLPPPSHDLGIHTSVNPNVSSSYLFKDVEPGTKDFMSGKVFGAPDAADSRIKPVLMDVKSALKYPADAIKWNDPERVIEYLESAMRGGFSAPKGLLSDMYNIGGTTKTWQDQFIPMLKDRGYDSVWYPHFDPGTGSSPYNTFMAFDPEQVVHRYSPEGVKLAKERGVKEPIRKVGGFDMDEGKFAELENWRLPKGILKPPDEVESLVKAHTLNTRPWWEDPSSSLYKIEEKYNQKQEAAAKQYKIWEAGNVPTSPGYGMNDAAINQLMDLNEQLATKKITPTEYDLAYHELKNSNVYKSPFDLKIHMADQEQYKLHDQLKKGKISEAEYTAEYNKLEAKKDQQFGKVLNESQLMSPQGILSAIKDSNLVAQGPYKGGMKWIDNLVEHHKDADKSKKMEIVNNYLQKKEKGEITQEEYVNLFKKMLGYVDNSSDPASLKAWEVVKKKKKAGLITSEESKAEYNKLFNQ
jgi:hypothetical protein